MERIRTLLEVVRNLLEVSEEVDCFLESSFEKSERFLCSSLVLTNLSSLISHIESHLVVLEWISLPTSSRRRVILNLLAALEVRDPNARLRASRALLYLLQGAFGDTVGPEHQMQWMMENARMVRGAGGTEECYNACKIASWKHDYLR